MADYSMPVLSEQERKIDIAQCLEELAALEKNLITWGDNWKDYIESKIRRQKIALAALTANPVAYKDSLGCFVTPRKGELLIQEGEAAYPLFMAPPVPVKQEGEQCGKCKGNGWFADEMGMRRCFMCNDLVQEGDHRD